MPKVGSEKPLKSKKSIIDYIPFAKSIASLFSTSSTTHKPREAENENDQEFDPEWQEVIDKQSSSGLLKLSGTLNVNTGRYKDVDEGYFNKKSGHVKRTRNVDMLEDLELENPDAFMRISKSGVNTPMASQRILIKPNRLIQNRSIQVLNNTDQGFGNFAVNSFTGKSHHDLIVEGISKSSSIKSFKSRLRNNAS